MNPTWNFQVEAVGLIT